MEETHPASINENTREQPAIQPDRKVTASRRLPKLTVGALISDSVKVAMANFIPFFLVVFLCTLPAFAWEYYATFSDNAPDPESSGYLLSTFLRMVLSYFLSVLSQAAMVYGTVQFLMGNKIPMGECFSKGISRILPAMGVAIVSYICIWLGIIALIIPGIMIACTLYVVIPVAVVESTGVSASLSRSAKLTKGSRMTLFLSLLIPIIIYLLACAMLGLVFGGVDSFLGWLMLQITALIWCIVASVLTAVAYMRLRELREGVDLKDLVKVFE